MSKVRRVDFSPEWKPGRWVAFDPIYPRSLPRAPGVYVISLDGVAVYVGQSADIRGRLGAHNIRPGYGGELITPWGSISPAPAIQGRAKISRRFGDWAMWELRLIRRLQPKFNSRGGPRPKRPKFAKPYDASWDDVDARILSDG